ISLGVTNFTRSGPTFDRNQAVDPGTLPPSPPAPLYYPGIDPIRKTTRVSITPSLYTTLRPFDTYTLIPSLELRSFYYSFPDQIPDLYRGYLLFRTDL